MEVNFFLEKVPTNSNINANQPMNDISATSSTNKTNPSNSNSTTATTVLPSDQPLVWTLPITIYPPAHKFSINPMMEVMNCLQPGANRVICR